MTPPRENQGNEAGGNRAKPPLNGRSAGRGGEDRDLLPVVVQLPGTDRERPPGLFRDQAQAQPGLVPAFLHRQLAVEDRPPAPVFALPACLAFRPAPRLPAHVRTPPVQAPRPPA